MEFSGNFTSELNADFGSFISTSGFSILIGPLILTVALDNLALCEKSVGASVVALFLV